MKLHEFTIYGGQTQGEDGNQLWPDYISIKFPRSVQLEIIKFLATSLQDSEMTEATINFVGEYKENGEKDQFELFGPTNMTVENKE